ncbi:hypothetical protein [Streptomyces roseochromogenus]|uniref:hypothetical protein n=1 Tax=Streptomyces roseochromogenus TaxID=285450 RepID=UPI001FD73830|nr:hypothetical protein [Streptomyces roseochromogenus]
MASAYRDTPVALPHGQVTIQPALIAMTVSAAGLTGDEQVLEVGTGYGSPGRASAMPRSYSATGPSGADPCTVRRRHRLRGLPASA